VGAGALEGMWQQTQPRGGMQLTIRTLLLKISLPWGTIRSTRGKSYTPTPPPPFRGGPHSALHADTQSITEERYTPRSMKNFYLKEK